MKDQRASISPHVQRNFAVIWAAMVLPGKSEAWRRFAQEMAHARQSELMQLCRQLGIQAMQIWIAETARGEVGVIAVVAVEPAQVMSQIATARLPFARWLRTQIWRLQGIDISQPPMTPPSDLVFEWRLERQ